MILSSMGKNISSGSSGYTSNFYAWYAQWRDTGIGRYGAEFRIQFENGASPTYNLEAKLEDYPMFEELPTTKDHWLCTADQHAELMAILHVADREYREKTLFISWFNARREINASARETNEVNKIKRAELIKGETVYQNTVAQIFAEVLGSMDRLSQERVTAHAEEREGEQYTMHRARAAGDWLFLFVAARATHVVRSQGVDGVSSELRHAQEEKTLREIKHTTGSFHMWLRSFRDQLSTCELIEMPLSEDKKKTIFMANIHRVLFSHTLTLWGSYVTRQQFPDDFEDLVSMIRYQHEELSTSDPALVQRCERRQQTEQSFGGIKDVSSTKVSGKSEDGSKNKKASKYKYVEGSKCPLCGDKHSPFECRRYYSKFSMEHNIDYWKRKDETEKAAAEISGEEQAEEKANLALEDSEDEDERRWIPTKGTIARPPAVKSEKNSYSVIKREMSYHLVPEPSEKLRKLRESYYGTKSTEQASKQRRGTNKHVPKLKEQERAQDTTEELVCYHSVTMTNQLLEHTNNVQTNTMEQIDCPTTDEGVAGVQRLTAIGVNPLATNEPLGVDSDDVPIDVELERVSHVELQCVSHGLELQREQVTLGRVSNEMEPGSMQAVENKLGIGNEEVSVPELELGRQEQEQEPDMPDPELREDTTRKKALLFEGVTAKPGKGPENCDRRLLEEHA